MTCLLHDAAGFVSLRSPRKARGRINIFWFISLGRCLSRSVGCLTQSRIERSRSRLYEAFVLDHNRFMSYCCCVTHNLTASLVFSLSPYFYLAWLNVYKVSIFSLYGISGTPYFSTYLALSPGILNYGWYSSSNDKLYQNPLSTASAVSSLNASRLQRGFSINNSFKKLHEINC